MIKLKPISCRIIFFVLVLCFVLLSIFVSRHPVWSFDVKFSLAIQQFQSDWLDQVMLAISIFGDMPFSFLAVFLVAAIFYFNTYKREALFIVLISLSSLIILGIKNIIDRPRPTAFYIRLMQPYKYQSFPSGHVMSYFVFFGFLILLMMQLKSISHSIRVTVISFSLFLMLTVAPSRIYLGAHWFTDTLGGALLGTICLFPLGYYYLKKANKG